MSQPSYQAVDTFVANPTRMKNRANAWERCSRIGGQKLQTRLGTLTKERFE